MKAKLFFSLFISISIISKLSAQEPVFKEATLAHPAELWKKFIIDENGSNVRDGVQFFKHGSECGGSKVKLFKVVNTNDYAVNISFQVDENSPVETVQIPASASLEGSCTSADKNQAKLVMSVKTDKAEGDKKKGAEYIRTHISVAKAQ